MFKLRVTGVVDHAAADLLVVHAPHATDGYRDPVVVFADLEDRMAEHAGAFAVGDRIWVEGHGYQRRVDTDDGETVALGLRAERMAEPTESLTPSLRSGRGHLQATVVCRIAEPLRVERAQSGKRAGDDVLQFKAHVQVPEMDAGQRIVLRCKLWGTEASWFQHRHQQGDWVMLEGDLVELRFGAGQRMHQLIVARWGFAKDHALHRSQARTIVSERVTERPLQSAPEVVRRGGS